MSTKGRGQPRNVPMAEPRIDITTAPLTPDRWDDVVIVFGAGRGVCSRCWCMYWRLPRREFEQSMGTAARKLFRARVEAGPPPGLIAYATVSERGNRQNPASAEPVGWVQVGPRPDVPSWNGTRRLSAPPIERDADDPSIWGISCFVVRPGWRGRGVAAALLAGAVDWARANDARVLDACPVDTAEKRAPISLYHGVASSFRRAGFTEILRRRADRPLMRLALRK